MEINIVTQWTLAILWVVVGLSRDLFGNEFIRWPVIIWDKMMHCLKCQVFWITLLTSFNLPLAALFSVAAAILDKYINS